MRSVLVVELLGGIGDLLLALPAVHALARTYPAARVSVLTLAPADELLRADPLVAEVLRAAPGDEERQRRTVAAAVDLVRPDLAVTTTRYGGIPALLESRVPRTVTDLWRRPPADERIDLRFLRLLTEDGVIAPRYAALEPRVALTPTELAAGRRAMGDAGDVALLVPDSGMDIKEWAPASFAALAGRLRADGWRVLAAGGGVVVPGAQLLPRSSLRGFAASLAACGVVVAGDTGPARLAAAVGTPTVALFGPTWAGRFGLRDGHASLQSPLPCNVRHPPDQTRQSCWYSGTCVFDDRRTCVDDLSVERVAAAVARVARRPAPPPSEVFAAADDNDQARRILT